MSKPTTYVGLRIDVDTYRGTQQGVPRLLSTLEKHNTQASFFFSVGPDNMGRHVWRLLKPKFLLKMLRSNAASLYGLDILLCGTFWPGPNIGKRLADTIKSADNGQHEIGLHAWDHQAWQARIEKWSDAQVEEQIQKGVDALEAIIGRKPDCSAVAGWRCDPRTVDIKHKFGFNYNSDCRGDTLFTPKLSDGTLGVTQVPVNLPTFDEVVGTETTAQDFNQYILDKMEPGKFHCYTIHAEVEGGIMADQFDELLSLAKDRNIEFIPLGQLIEQTKAKGPLPTDKVVTGELAGREGWVGWQQSALAKE